MALFSGKNKNDTENSEATLSAVSSVSLKGRTILLGAHITEKAAALSDKKVYTFDVSPDANKKEVAQAIEKAYGVTPIKIRMVTTRDRVRVRRGYSSRISDGKKAYVYLDKKDSIELF